MLSGVEGQVNKLSEQRRNFHVSKRNENMLIVGGVGVIVAAMGAQYAVDIYNARKAAQAAAPPTEGAASGSTSTDGSAQKGGDGANAAASGGFSGMFNFSTNTWFARNFYDGGFEEKMTKREAALILGLRESASADRIKETHRKILLINHPDRGGSVYLAAKINEAKDLLLKGKQ
jgi:hypothetical protein